MSYSKNFNVNQCRSGLKHLRSFGSGESAEKLLVSKRLLFLKNMSVNQWKLVSQLKDQITKTAADKNQIMLLLNREWTNILKKLPSISAQVTSSHYGDTKVTKSDMLVKEDSNFLQESMSSIPQVLSDLKMRLSQQTVAIPEEKNKWKTKKKLISDISIHARTKYVLNSVSTAESEGSKLKRLEDLVDHLLLYPDAVDLAVKNGALKMLLQIRNKTQEENALEAVREALAMLGYVDPPPNHGIRILSIDGGGIRGLLVMELLLKLEELTGKKTCELFDYICGVSTGSVIACTIGASGKSIREISLLYKELSMKLFTQNAIFGTGNLILTHGYYDTAMWEGFLKEHVGCVKLIKTTRQPTCPKIGAISTVCVNKNQVLPFIFRNYELPYRVKSQYMGSYKYELWEAARASAAAPTYFGAFHLEEYMHQDGGILVNNPTAVAVHEAKQLWPDTPIECVVSFGTGRIDPIVHAGKVTSTKQTTSWIKDFNRILGSATDTEGVHSILNDLLPPSVYFRFNPYVTELVSMAECRPEKLDVLLNDALMYYRRNEEKFQAAAAALTKGKTRYQKMKDWLALQSIILGGHQY